MSPEILKALSVVELGAALVLVICVWLRKSLLAGSLWHLVRLLWRLVLVEIRVALCWIVGSWAIWAILESAISVALRWTSGDQSTLVAAWWLCVAAFVASVIRAYLVIRRDMRGLPR